MTRPYSVDLRERVVRAMGAGASCRSAVRTTRDAATTDADLQVRVPASPKWHQTLGVVVGVASWQRGRHLHPRENRRAGGQGRTMRQEIAANATSTHSPILERPPRSLQGAWQRRANPLR
jgi:hypothetical protein